MKRLLMWLGAFALVVLACGGSGPNGASALCGVNGSNQCAGGQPFCSPTLGCVQCNRDADCPMTAPRCVEGRCSACATNADCSGATATCWADHQCHVACTTGSCGDTIFPMCDPTTADCIECNADADCTTPLRPLCDTTLKQCVACLHDGDCSAGRCNLGNHTCVQCLANSDCSATQPICDPQQGFTCRPGCSSDAQCVPDVPFCNTTLETCVQCTKNEDCPSSAPVCNASRGVCTV